MASVSIKGKATKSIFKTERVDPVRITGCIFSVHIEMTTSKHIPELLTKTALHLIIYFFFYIFFLICELTLIDT